MGRIRPLSSKAKKPDQTGNLMQKKHAPLGLLLLTSVLGSACSTPEPGVGTPDVRTYAMQRTVRLPVQRLEAGMPPPFPPVDSLVTTGGAEDELPRGPQSFDVLPGGGFVVADPLQQRLAFFDSTGAFAEAWPLGFAVTRLTLMEDGRLEVRRADTGDYAFVDAFGDVQPVSAQAQASRAVGVQGEARLDRSLRNQGRITWPSARSGAADALDVRLEADSTEMVSLRSLGTDRRGYTFVALETTGGGEEIDVQTVIHLYDPDGRLAGRITDVPSDADLHPEDAFRVRGGHLYQLVVQPGEVLIHVWETG